MTQLPDTKYFWKLVSIVIIIVLYKHHLNYTWNRLCDHIKNAMANRWRKRVAFVRCDCWLHFHFLMDKHTHTQIHDILCRCVALMPTHKRSWHQTRKFIFIWNYYQVASIYSLWMSESGSRGQTHGKKRNLSFRLVSVKFFSISSLLWLGEDGSMFVFTNVLNLCLSMCLY